MLAFDVYNLLFAFLFTLGLQLLLFVFAVIFRTDRLTDISYAATFALLVIVLWFLESDRDRFAEFRSVLMLICVCTWALRLGAYLFYRILVMGRDQRFDGIREKPFSFLAFWSFQALIVWITSLPFIVVLSMPRQSEPGWVEALGVFLFTVGFLMETVADAQKFRFRRNPENKHHWIQHGLWRFSRHPNYFGESLAWTGIFVIAIPVLAGWLWLVVLSPLVLTAILLFFSGIPLLEQRALERFGDDPEYRRYRKNTSLFIPWIPGKS